MLTLKPHQVQQAAELLVSGQLVGLPTETVYGLGGLASRDAVVARIFEAKQRPSFNPLIAHVFDLQAAERIAQFDPLSRRLAAQFWPGPLTLVLPRRTDAQLSWLVSAGMDTVAVRVPDHPLTLEVLRLVAAPVAAPSANPSGRLSPTTAADVAEALGGRVTAVLDGGPCRVGVESTVLRCVDNVAWLLRPGGLARQQLEPVCGPLHRAQDDEHPRSPGQLASHYAPLHPVRLDVSAVRPGEALLAFGPQPLTGAVATLNLSPSGDLTEAATHLFAYLRALDAVQPRAIAVMPIPGHGLGEAIGDRLRRAAATATP